MKNLLMILLFLIVSSTLFCQAKPDQTRQDTLNILISLYDEYATPRENWMSGMVYSNLDETVKDTVWVRYDCNGKEEYKWTSNLGPDTPTKFFTMILEPYASKCHAEQLDKFIEWYITTRRLKKL